MPVNDYTAVQDTRPSFHKEQARAKLKALLNSRSFFSLSLLAGFHIGVDESYKSRERGWWFAEGSKYYDVHGDADWSRIYDLRSGFY